MRVLAVLGLIVLAACGENVAAPRTDVPLDTIIIFVASNNHWRVYERTDKGDRFICLVGGPNYDLRSARSIITQCHIFGGL